MEHSRRSIAAGIIIALVAAGFVLWERTNFLELKPLGTALFAVSLLLCVLIGAAIAAHPSRDRKWYPLWQGLVFLMAPMGAVAAVERLNGNLLSDLHATGWMWVDNYCVALLFFLLIFALSGSVRIPVFIMNPVFLAFGLANMYVKEFKGGPLVPMDVGSIATAATVATGYTYNIGAEVCYACLVTLLMLVLAAPLGMRKAVSRRAIHARRALRLLSVLTVAGTAGLFYGTDFLIHQGYKPDFFNQARGYKNKGAILEFMVNTRYLRQNKPSGYDADEVGSAVLKALPTEEPAGTSQQPSTDEAASGKKPNIIVVMNESFADLKVLGDFQTNRDYMPFLHSLKENTIQGNAYVSVLGTGTSNTEFEFLTGNTMAFLPAGSNAYQLYVKGEQPGLVSTLEAQGYQTVALHPYFRGNWNRVKVYDLMGFDKYIGLEDMFPEEIVTRYQERMSPYTFRSDLKSEYGREDILLRQYVSDKYNYEEVIRQYNKRDKSKPFFLFNVTMQNHSPYDLAWYGMKDRVNVENAAEPSPLADQYLSLVLYSDRALKRLVDYFDKVDDPTIILFFGDHQPYIENEFISEVMGTDVTSAEGAELQKRYISHMMLWANYDIPDEYEGTIDGISVNYLSGLLLQVAGLRMTDYDRYLTGLRQKIPVITAMGALDADGQYFRVDEDNPYEEELSVYQNAAYNNLTDLKHRADSLFNLHD